MKLLAIDGNSILNRAYYGVKLLSNKKGVFTNAVTGFMNIYLKETDIVKPDCIAVAFDLKAPTFRHQKVSTYKANRKGMPEELAMQLPLIKKLLAALGIKIVECEGFEADDVLGTLSALFSDSGNECIILTGDRDNLQLINAHVHVRLVTNKETIEYDEKLFTEQYGFEPVHLIDLKALMGDSSDNISGVSGIGEKTASALIKEYRTIEKLYESLENAQLTKSVMNKLSTGKSDAEQSKWLATIVKNAPVDTSPESYRPVAPDEKAVSLLLSELEMFRLLERLNIKPVAVPDDNAKERQEKINLPDNINAGILDETRLSEILKGEKADFIYSPDSKEISLYFSGGVYNTRDQKIILRFMNSDTKKRTFAAKPAYRFAFENGSELENIVFDAEIAAYLLDSSLSEYNPENLCLSYGIEGADNPDIPEVVKISFLCDVLERRISELKMENLMSDIELPLTCVLASMETAGVKTDTDGVKEFGRMLSGLIEECTNQIYELSGHTFNISSPKQLGDVLFNKLGLPAGKKNKNGYSTSIEVLEELRDKHPVIEHIIKYRQLTKLNSTYVEGLLKTVGNDGRIHSIFKQTETRTGRISSTEPNMQNIPVRTELGREMRKFFTADEGRILLDADYSQIELRIMAHLCGDKNMQQAFTDGLDIHTMTASQVFDMPPVMVTSSMRSAAKAVNFGIIYGIGAFSLSKDIGVSVAEANRYIKNYLNNYPEVGKFMDRTVTEATEKGYVTTMYGRRRYVPELKASNKIMQAAGKRIAMNTPVQGTAADIIKIAMVNVYERLKKEKLDAKLILQVHDELIVDSSEADAERAGIILEEEMTNAARLSIPLIAEVNKGRTWYDAKR